MTLTRHTIDPADWGAFRELAHQMVDDMVDHISTLSDQPAWRPQPDGHAQRFSASVPQHGEGEASAYRAFVEDVLPYANGNAHPRFYGWVQGNGTPLGMMADMLASGMNPHMAGFNQAPVLVEEQVIRWMVELMGFPNESGGILVGGGSIANMLGLAIARNEQAGCDMREYGLQAESRQFAIYASSETHGWITKAAELLGMGRVACRTIPVGDDFRMNLEMLQSAIAQDRTAGLLPICVIGNAGTVNTGATDDLTKLAQICRDEQLWFHIDGAFGALAAWSPELRGVVSGLDLADSVAFDLHKWAYLPFTVACLLVRDNAVLERSFATKAHYLAAMERGVSAGGMRFANRGIELTREFRALKVWLNLKAYGAQEFGNLILQNVQQARWLGERVDLHPELELLAPVQLNIVCFRYCTGTAPSAEHWNAVNQELLLRLQESGAAVPSSTVLGGRFAIRCCFVNHRTQPEDLESLINAVVEVGRTINVEFGVERAGIAAPDQET